MSDPTAVTSNEASTPGPSPGSQPGRSGPPGHKHKRKLSNYLLDKKLQLRYVLIVTILSGLIAGVLGFKIYEQRHQSTASIEDDLKQLVQDPEDIENITEDFESEDRLLVYKMVGVGVGLVVILSLYLIIMTHKVAGPLFKTSIYFDRMATGRLSVVTPLRQGDMLQEFFTNFTEMHDAVRARTIEDVATMESATQALRESRNQGDYRGEAHTAFAEELEQFEQHVARRKKQLV